MRNAIVFITDDIYAMPTGVAIESLIQNKNPETVYDIFLIANNLSAKNIAIFKKFNAKNIYLKIIQVKNSYKHFKITKNDFHVSTAAILKFELPNLLPNLDKILYLDGDIIAKCDLKEIYQINIEGKYAAVVKDIKPVLKYNPSHLEKLNIKHTAYFNSGVMLLNLKEMRQDNISSKLFDYRQHGINFFMDQDAFNVVFGDNVRYISVFNNFLVTLFESFTIKEVLTYYNIEDDITNEKDLLKNSNIMHFSSKYKPWKYYDSNFADEWYFYYLKSPLSNKKLKRCSIKGNKISARLGIKAKMNKNECSQKNIIISLTSYPARIKTVHLAIETLLQQTITAEKIVLNLGEDKFLNKEQDLPQELLRLTSQGLEINWCRDIRSFTKLIPTLKKYPDKIIVTADDDILYPNDWLEKLYKAYLAKPKLIHCHRVHRILFDKRRNIMPYNEWEICIENIKPSYNNFLTGAGGVLYPPNSFYKDILNEDLFEELCPTGDDIWFWAMAVLNNKKINVIKNNHSDLKYIEGTQEYALWNENKKGKNDEQLKKVFDHYPELLKKLEKKNLSLKKIILKIKRIIFTFLNIIVRLLKRKQDS